MSFATENKSYSNFCFLSINTGHSYSHISIMMMLTTTMIMMVMVFSMEMLKYEKGQTFNKNRNDSPV